MPMADPFQPGARYRVRQSFAALRCRFSAGDELVYDRSAWSRYDGITGYFFHGVDGSYVWDVYDGDPVDIWPTLFEPLD